MAYIYVITNLINQKQYVGKTTKSIEQRWKTHIADSKRSNIKNRPLYKAFAKYGVDNFIIQKLEYCSAEKASDREQYWINKLDTYENGYNATLGGDSKHYYNYSEIGKKYLELKSLKATSAFFQCDIDTVRTACLNQNIKIIPTSEQNKKKVAMYDLKNNFICNFNSLIEAYQWLYQNHFTLVKTPKGVTSHISAVCKGKRKTAYKHIWKYI